MGKFDHTVGTRDSGVQALGNFEIHRSVPNALKNAIVDFCDQRTTAKTSHYLNPIARKFALENLNKDFILTRFEKQLEELAYK